jgi:hypothetical protein
VPATAPLTNGHTVPLNPLKDVAFHALGNAYSIGYVVVGGAAAVSAALVLMVLRIGSRHDADELAEAPHEDYGPA